MWATFKLQAAFISSLNKEYLIFSFDDSLNVPCHTFKYTTRFGRLKVFNKFKFGLCVLNNDYLFMFFIFLNTFDDI